MEIKFRGQRVDNKEWIYGNLFTFDKKSFILPNKSTQTNGCGYSTAPNEITIFNFKEVIPETVGQFTGLQDSALQEIYHHDIMWSDEYECYGELMWHEGAFYLRFENIIELLSEHTDWEVVGNRFENPELLEEQCDK